jgi:hypothetical protein
MRKLALALIVLAAVGAAAVGARYSMATEFMPYHAVVAGKSWSQLEPGVQAIVLGMLRILGASFIAFAIALLAFAWGGWRGDRWPAVGAALSGLVLAVPTLYVTLHLRTLNPRAETPVGLTAILLALILAGSVLLWIANGPSHRRVGPHERRR